MFSPKPVVHVPSIFELVAILLEVAVCIVGPLALNWVDQVDVLVGCIPSMHQMEQNQCVKVQWP